MLRPDYTPSLVRHNHNFYRLFRDFFEQKSKEVHGRQEMTIAGSLYLFYQEPNF